MQNTEKQMLFLTQPALRFFWLVENTQLNLMHVPLDVGRRSLGHYTPHMTANLYPLSRSGPHFSALQPEPILVRQMTGLAMAFVSPFVMTVGGGASSDSGGRGVGGSKGSVPRSRLSEFSFAGGDRAVQSELVREVMKRAAEVGLTDAIDGKIAEFEGGAKTNMHGILYVSDIQTFMLRPSGLCTSLGLAMNLTAYISDSFDSLYFGSCALTVTGAKET